MAGVAVGGGRAVAEVGVAHAKLHRARGLHQGEFRAILFPCTRSNLTCHKHGGFPNAFQNISCIYNENIIFYVAFCCTARIVNCYSTLSYMYNSVSVTEHKS